MGPFLPPHLHRMAIPRAFFCPDVMLGPFFFFSWEPLSLFSSGSRCLRNLVLAPACATPHVREAQLIQPILEAGVLFFISDLPHSSLNLSSSLISCGMLETRIMDLYLAPSSAPRPHDTIRNLLALFPFAVSCLIPAYTLLPWLDCLFIYL